MWALFDVGIGVVVGVFVLAMILSCTCGKKSRPVGPNYYANPRLDPRVSRLNSRHSTLAAPARTGETSRGETTQEEERGERGPRRDCQERDSTSPTGDQRISSSAPGAGKLNYGSFLVKVVSPGEAPREEDGVVVGSPNWTAGLPHQAYVQRVHMVKEICGSGSRSRDSSRATSASPRGSGVSTGVAASSTTTTTGSSTTILNGILNHHGITTSTGSRKSGGKKIVVLGLSRSSLKDNSTDSDEAGCGPRGAGPGSAADSITKGDDASRQPPRLVLMQNRQQNHSPSRSTLASGTCSTRSAATRDVGKSFQRSITVEEGLGEGLEEEGQVGQLAVEVALEG